MSHTDIPAAGEPTRGRPGRIPSRRGYLLAALLAVGGVLVSVVLQLVVLGAVSSHADGFQRASVPGELTVHAAQATTYYVYAEGTLSLHPSVRVTDPAGKGVAVKTTSSGPHYDHGGNGGSAIGTFDATNPGDYRVAVGTGSDAQGDFAVGDRFPLWMRLLPDSVAWAIVAIGAGAGIVVATVTAVRRRRRASVA
ncbi:hypothetical protein ABEG17_08650 [Pedococcus sp. KACC 23699]|uniref:Uncharacterized protein n=1 Tax=Pedococcus sp. KACC 23699 TaxID=3149228 RepID=A0AAU7JYN7_9MICO